MTDLPVNFGDNDPGHTGSHNLTNIRVNEHSVLVRKQTASTHSAAAAVSVARVSTDQTHVLTVGANVTGFIDNMLNGDFLDLVLKGNAGVTDFTANFGSIKSMQTSGALLNSAVNVYPDSIIGVLIRKINNVLYGTITEFNRGLSSVPRVSVAASNTRRANGVVFSVLSGLAANDLLVAVLNSDATNTATWTLPSGFVALTNYPYLAADAASSDSEVASKIAVGNEGTLSFNNTAESTVKNGVLFAFRRAGTVTAAVPIAGSSVTADTPATTGAITGSMHVLMVTTNGTTTANFDTSVLTGAGYTIAQEEELALTGSLVAYKQVDSNVSAINIPLGSTTRWTSHSILVKP